MKQTSLSKFAQTLAVAAGWRLALVVSIAAACSFTEGIGVVLLIPTLQAAGINLIGQGNVGRYAQVISLAFQRVGITPTLPILLLAFIVLVSTRTLMATLEVIAGSSVQQRFVRTLRERLYRSIASADWLFLCRKKSADLVHALTAEIERIGIAAKYAEMLAVDSLVSAVYVFIALALSMWVSILVLVAGMILMLVLRGRTRALQETGAEISRANQGLYGAAMDHVQNLKAVKAYNSEARDGEAFAGLSGRVAAACQETARRLALMSWWVETGSVAILGSAVYVSVRVFSAAPAEIMILLLVFARLMPRLIAAHRDYQGLLNDLPAFGIVTNLEKECRAAEEIVAPGQPVRLGRRLELRDISFAYLTGAKPVVDQINISIDAGQIVAIVGVSGSGKSTLADIIMGLLKPDAGQVLVDGAPIAESNLRSWREQIGYVSMDTVLFHGTVRSNLLWAHPQATEEEFWEALSAAAADDLVRRLPDGLDTVVGDRGSLLSQGERQRLAIARALLRQPSMLIFDEATNSLDSENEARVLGAVDRLRGRVTTLLIAHRPSTIERADVVYLIDRGKVVESGDWQTLFAKQHSRIRAIYERNNLHDAMRS